MSAIGEIVTQSDLISLQKYTAQSAVKTGYVAPTVYRNTKVSGWNYYKTLTEAVRQWAYINGVPGYIAQTPAGSVKFTSTAATETMGINVDFFYPDPKLGILVSSYAWVKQMIETKKVFTCVIRFYKTDGSGAYYAVLDSRYLSIAATVTSKLPADKIAALDNFHREVQLLKYKYNSLANFLTELSKKKLNTTQQQIFNEGILMLNNMEKQLRQIKGVEINFANNGTVAGVGIIPILIIIAIALVAAVTGWTIVTINAEIEKTKKLNASYDLQKWVAEQNLKIQKDNTLTPAQKADLINQNAGITKSAQDAAAAVTTATPGIFDKVENILMLGIVGVIVFKFLPSRNNN